MKHQIFAIFASYIAFLPFYVLGILFLVAHEELPWMLGLFLVMYFYGFLMGKVIRKEPILVVVVGVFTASILGGVVMAVTHSSTITTMFTHILTGLSTFLPFWFGKNIAQKPWYEATVPAVNVTLLLSNAVILLFVYASWAFDEWTWAYVGAVALSAPVAIISMNKSNLEAQLHRTTRFARKEGEEKTHTPLARHNALSPSIRRHNRVIVTSIFLLVALLTPLVGFGLSAAGDAIVSALNTRSEISYEAPLEAETEDDEKADISEPEEQKEVPQAFKDISNMVFACIVAAFLVVFFVVLLVKGKNWLRDLFANGKEIKDKHRKKHKSDESQIYEEEVEELEIGGLTLEKVKDIVKEKIGFVMMKNEEERIRYLFRRAVRKGETKGYHRRISATPREILKDLSSDRRVALDPAAASSLAGFYESTRYDHTPPPDGTAAKLKNELNA